MKGVVHEYVQNEYVEIYTPMGTFMKIQWDDIQEIDFSPSTSNGAKTVLVERKKLYPMADKGFFLKMNLSTGWRLDSWGDLSLVPGGELSIGRTFRSQHLLSASVGYHYYFFPDNAFTPICLEYDYRLRKEGKTPFFYVRSGYGILSFSEYIRWLNGTAKGGLNTGFGIGFMKKTRPHSTRFFSIGMTRQLMSAEYWDQIFDDRIRDVFVKEKVFYNSFDIRFGYIFD